MSSDQEDVLSGAWSKKRGGSARKAGGHRVDAPMSDFKQKNVDTPEPGKLTTERMGELLHIIATNPDDVVHKLARDAGFPYHATANFIKRLRIQGGALKETVQKLGRRELVEKLDEKISLGLHFMDDFALAGMDGKDLAIMIGILIEKKQLLEGRPTQILSFEERKHLSELLPAYVREAARRGITIDATAVEIREEPRPLVTLPDEIREDAVSATARHAVTRTEDQL